MYNWTFKYRNPSGLNLLNPLDIVVNLRIQGLTGVNAPSTNWITSGFIDINENQQYTFDSGGNLSCRDVTYYDEKGIYIGGDYNETQLNLSTSPDRAKKMRLSFRKTSGDNYDTNLVGAKESILTPFETYFFEKKINPIYKKMNRGYQKQSGAEFYREKLSGGFKLVKSEYDLVDSRPFDERMYIVIEDTLGYFNDYVGYFYKTDCKFDEDCKIVEVKTKPNDDYEAVLGGMQKEYNLIDINAQTETITYQVRPIYQLYVLGDQMITNSWGGNVSFKEVEREFDANKLLNDYRFVKGSDVFFVSKNNQSSLSTDVTGVYSFFGSLGVRTDTNVLGGDLDIVIEIDSRVNDNGTTIGPNASNDDFTEWRTVFKSRVSGTKTNLYASDWRTTQNVNPETLTYNGIDGSTGSFIIGKKEIFRRTLLHSLDLSNPLNQEGINFWYRGSNDIYEENKNYPIVVIGGTIGIQGSLRTSSLVNNFGRVPNGFSTTGQYYEEKTTIDFVSISNNEIQSFPQDTYMYPVNKVEWGEVSLWASSSINSPNSSGIGGDDSIYLRDELHEIQLKEAYKLSSVINSLLAHIGSNVTFSNNANYSEFLYSTNNPVSNIEVAKQIEDVNFPGFFNLGYSDIGNFDLYITPKSNIVVSNFEQPAQKANITLDNILRFLRNSLKLYWHIENGRLRIEHISWYNNGGSYINTVLSTDLTTLIQPRNNKQWQFALNKYEFEKENMPERYQYGWMDDVSVSFEGHNIDILSGYVKEGRIEDVTTTNFTTDIDFILANPTDVSKDGFCMLATFNDNGVNRVGYRVDNYTTERKLHFQNGLLSWLYLHKLFHVYSLPSNRVRINNEILDITTTNVTRYKKQDLTYPTNSPINPYGLIRTSLGDGKIDKLDVSMESYIVKATIKHDTE